MHCLLEVPYDWLYGLGTDQLTEQLMVDWLTDSLSLFSEDWPTDWKIYGLIDWLTDSIVWRRTNWLSDLWLIKLSRDWPTDSMIYGYLNCLGRGQLTEWFMAGWLTHCLTVSLCMTDSAVKGLTRWLNDLRLITWLTNWLNDLWLIELSRDWPTDWMIYGWLTVSLIDLGSSMGNALTPWNTVWLTLLSTDWPSDWMI